MTDKSNQRGTVTAGAAAPAETAAKPARNARYSAKTRPPERYRATFLEDLDGRYTAARVLRARLQTLYRDLGGPDALSYQQQSLCKRAIHLEWRLEENERRLALGEGKPATEAAHTQMLNSLIGLYRALGLERRAKRVPDLKAYLEEQYAKSDDH